ncbi:MAG: STAS domain-containing protein [Chloroflexi bacterium OHK40]
MLAGRRPGAQRAQRSPSQTKGVSRVNVEQIDDVLVIELPPRLDAVGVAALESQLAEAVTAHKGKVLADMSQVNFVASLALRMLLSNLKVLQPLGGDLRLAALQPQIAEIFRKSRFDTLFKIYPDRESALVAYKS